MSNESEFVRLVGEVSADTNDLVKGCIIGLLDTMAITPSSCITVTPVKDVKVESGLLMAGYVFTVLTSLRTEYQT
jgi:hypothetical protein